MKTLFLFLRKLNLVNLLELMAVLFIASSPGRGYSQTDTLNTLKECFLLNLNVSGGNVKEFQISLGGLKFHPIKNTPVRIGYGIQTHLLSDEKATLFPASRRLRNYQTPDILKGEDIRIWTIGLVLGLTCRINKNIYFLIIPEIASVNAGNTQIFQYDTNYNPELYTREQDAKPSPSGLINPLLRLKGSLQLYTGLQIRMHRNISLGLNYNKVRYEFTTYKLLNFRNDRFMRSLSLWGIGLTFRIEQDD